MHQQDLGSTQQLLQSILNEDRRLHGWTVGELKFEFFRMQYYIDFSFSPDNQVKIPMPCEFVGLLKKQNRKSIRKIRHLLRDALEKYTPKDTHAPRPVHFRKHIKFFRRRHISRRGWPKSKPLELVA